MTGFIVLDTTALGQFSTVKYDKTYSFGETSSVAFRQAQLSSKPSRHRQSAKSDTAKAYYSPCLEDDTELSEVPDLAGVFETPR